MKLSKSILAFALAAALLPLAAGAQDRSFTRIVVRPRGWIGINFDFMSETRDGKTTETLTVLDVIKDSPAEKAGVKKGDRILSIDGEEITANRFERVARVLQPGDTVKLRISSDGRVRDLTLVAADRPTDDRILMLGDRGQLARIYLERMDSLFGDTTRFRFPDVRVFSRMGMDTMFERGIRLYMDTLSKGFAFSGPRPGLRFEFPNFEVTAARSVAGAEFTPLNPGLAQYFQTDRGILVIRVAPETPAARAGLEPGDVITRIDDRVVDDVPALRAAVTRARESTLKLSILRKG
ncbi:MAG TPA: PDZ domain-containing protein, partial [Longimicrobiales bacterium]|nr:PDZ domain-containing protein [Longimicrobiales bacterium]